MATLSKKQEKLIRSLHTRHGCKKHDSCVCEGLRCCSELFEARPDLVEFVVCSENFTSTIAIAEPFFCVPVRDFSRFAVTVNAQGIMAVAARPEMNFVPGADDDFVLALDRVADPGNFGTILRTAKAAGLSGIWFTSGSVDPFNAKVLRSALAAQFSLGLREFANLEAMRTTAEECGFKHFFLSSPRGQSSLFDKPELYERSVIVIGNEASGVASIDAESVSIPMPGNFESINAAQAATVFLFEYVRRTHGTSSRLASRSHVEKSCSLSVER